MMFLLRNKKTKTFVNNTDGIADYYFNDEKHDEEGVDNNILGIIFTDDAITLFPDEDWFYLPQLDMTFSKALEKDLIEIVQIEVPRA